MIHRYKISIEPHHLKKKKRQLVNYNGLSTFHCVFKLNLLGFLG